MAKMRKGTHVGFDKNLKNICVGDRIKDAEGNIYTIDSYGKAITPDDKKGFKSFDLSQLKDIEFFAREIDPASEKQLDPGQLPGFNPGDTSVHEAPDRMLAEELRRRGWDVTATRTVSL